jgi:heme-degrading monooxygenase HmoA
MNTSIIEIVKWQAATGVADETVIEAAANLPPDLKSIGGFIQKTLYKNDDEWVDVYYWHTLADAQFSNERMANKASLAALFAIIKPETVSITVMSKV